MNSSEKISVIIPVYNTEKYVEGTVRSVMNQTYENLEIICVNDGSTDGSLAILQNLAKEDARIKVIDKPNGGLSDARNAGLSVATSEWIGFVDADDILVPEAIEKVSVAFEFNPDCIHFGIKVVREDGRPVGKDDRSYYDLPYEGLKTLDDDVIMNIDYSACNKLFRRSIIDKYGIVFEHIHYEDFQFCMQYFSVINKVYYVKDSLYMYLRRGGSIMANTFKGSPTAIDHLYAYDYVYRFIEKNGLLERYKALLQKLFIAYYCLAIRFTTSDRIPDITSFAAQLYFKYKLLNSGITLKMQNGTLIFYLKKRVSVFSRMMEKVFSLNYEYINYRRYKVMRLFGFILMSSPR